MRRWVRTLAVAAVVAAVAAPPVRGQAPGGETTAVAGELGGIRETLESLVALLRDVRFQGEAELLLRRIELRERRIAPAEAALREAESEVEAIQAELARLEAYRSDEESVARNALPGGPEDEARVQRLREIDQASRALAPQLEAAETRVRRLEDRLALERKEIERLDARLDALLEERE